MVLDRNNVGESYRGLGDAITWAWIAEGSKRTHDPISFYTTDQHMKSLFAWLGQPLAETALNAVVSNGYNIEMGEQGIHPRWMYMCRGIRRDDIKPVRPPIRGIAVPQRPFKDDIILAPGVSHHARAWPREHWVSLYMQLDRNGLKPYFLVETPDKLPFNPNDFRYPLRVKHSHSIFEIAGMMVRARAVVGVDSMAAHLAGTVGVPTIALMGPTRRMVFSHIPEVEPIDSGLFCTGCCFNSPHYERKICSVSCASLFKLTPDKVEAKIMRRLYHPL